MIAYLLFLGIVAPAILILAFYIATNRLKSKQITKRPYGPRK